MRRIGVVLALMLAAGAARAATLDGITLPDHYQVGGQSLVLNGIGVRTVTLLNVRIYVAGLYLPQPNHDAAQILGSTGPKVILLQYLHGGSKTEVQEEYRKGEQVNCGGGGCAQADAGDFDRLVAAAPGVKVGDTTTYIITNQGLQVLANNAPIGNFTNKDLGFRILSGFIGPHPPMESLKSRLLGLAG